MAELLAAGRDWKNLTLQVKLNPDRSAVVTFAGTPAGKHPELRLTASDTAALIKELTPVAPPPPPPPPAKVLLGCALDVNNIGANDKHLASWAALFGDEVSLQFGLKPQEIVGAAGALSFTGADPVIAACQALKANVEVMDHCAFWALDERIPGYWKETSTKATLEARLVSFWRAYTEYTVSKYEKIRAIHFNEGFNDDGSLKANHVLSVVGPSYVDLFFKTVTATLKALGRTDVMVGFNEYNTTETWNTTKVPAIAKELARLRALGYIANYCGHQHHVQKVEDVPATEAEWRTQLEALIDPAVTNDLTEADIPKRAGNQTLGWQRTAVGLEAGIFGACVIWGEVWADSWEGDPEDPVLENDEFHAVPEWYGPIAKATGHSIEPPVTEEKAVTLALTSEHHSVIATSAPDGTKLIKFAYAKDANTKIEGPATGGYAEVAYPLTAPFAPPAGFSYVTGQALSAPATPLPGTAGGWSTGVLVTPVAPPEEPPHVGELVLGVTDLAGWGTAAAERMVADGITASRIALLPAPSTSTEPSGYPGPAACKADGVKAMNYIVGNVNDGTTLAAANLMGTVANTIKQIEWVYANDPEAVAINLGNEMYLKGGQAEPALYGEWVVAVAEAARAKGLTKIPLAFNTFGDYKLPNGSFSQMAAGNGWCADLVRANPEILTFGSLLCLVSHPYGPKGGDYDGNDWGLGAMRACREQMIKLGFPNPVFICDEFGEAVNGEHAGNEQKQAEVIEGAIEELIADGWVKFALVYTVHDDGTGQFGIVSNTSPFTPRAAYGVLSKFCKQLAAA